MYECEGDMVRVQDVDNDHVAESETLEERLSENVSDVVVEMLLVMESLNEWDFEMEIDIVSLGDALEENDPVAVELNDRVIDNEFELLRVTLKVLEPDCENVNEWLFV